MNERMTEEKKINLSFRQRNETIHDVVGCESIEHLEKSHSNWLTLPLTSHTIPYNRIQMVDMKVDNCREMWTKKQNFMTFSPNELACVLWLMEASECVIVVFFFLLAFIVNALSLTLILACHWQELMPILFVRI